MYELAHLLLVVLTCSSSSLGFDSGDRTVAPHFDSEYKTLPPSIFKDIRPTRILIIGADYVQKTKLQTPFTGYIAKIGTSINITCQLNNTSDQLFITRSLANGTVVKEVVVADGSRVTQVRDGTYLNTSINDLHLADSGRYHCVDDLKQLAILNPDEPASVIDHRCVSHGFNDLKCVFYTNCTTHHLMEWQVSWSTREKRLCKKGPCEGMVCELTTPENLLHISRITRHDRLQRVSCTIKGFLFVGVTYDFTVVGDNSVARSIVHVTTKLNSSIVLLEPPYLIGNTTDATKIKLKVQLNESHISGVPSVGGTAVSHVEQGVQRYGLRYSIAYTSKTGEWLKRRVVNSTTSELSISKLFPYTMYSFTLKYQMANTINTDLWSLATHATIRTSEREPWAAPLISPVGFSFLSNLYGDCKKDERLVMLFWKAVRNEPGAGNGVITSYSVFNLASSAQVTKKNDSIIYDDPKQVAEVSGNKTSATTCVDSSQHALGVLAQNSAGPGPVTTEVKIPSTEQRIKLNECEISVVGDKDKGSFSIGWSHQETAYNYTIFMCRPGKTDGLSCEEGTLKWYVVKPGHNSTSVLPYDPTYFGYKFGLVRLTSNSISSGIVWTRCVSDMSINLEAPKLLVLINGVKAQVEIRDECLVNKQLAKSYVLHYCLYDSGQMECKEPEQTRMMSRCLMNIEITLLQHSSDYAFWLDATNDVTVTSSIYVKRTGMRELETWEIALIVVFVFIFIMVISVSSVFAHKQMMKVKAFKSPRIVMPTQLMIEEDCDSDTGNDRANDQTSLMDEYLTLDIPMEEHEMTAKQPTTESFTLPLLSAESFNHSESDYYSLGARPRQRPSGPVDDPPFESNDNNDYGSDKPSSGYSKVLPSLSSYRQLPEEYLQCTAIAPEFSMSGGSLYTDQTSGGVIDISKYLLDTEDMDDDPSKLAVDLDTYPSNTRMEPSHKQVFVDLPDHTSADKLHVELPMRTVSNEKLLHVDLPHTTSNRSSNSLPDSPYQTLSSHQDTSEQPHCSDEQNDNSSDSTSCKSQEHSLSSSIEISAGTSGDSGYDGPNSRQDKKKSKLNKNQKKSDDANEQLEDVGG